MIRKFFNFFSETIFLVIGHHGCRMSTNGAPDSWDGDETVTNKVLLTIFI